MATRKETAIREAAAAVRERIRQDRAQVGAPIRDFLDHIDAHLLYEKLDALSGMTACGINNGRFPVEFHATLSVPPAAYIENCRMEIAARLLEGEEAWKIQEISDLCGYSVGSAFSRAFRRWSGQGPTEYRRRVAELRATGIKIPDARFLETRWLQKLEAGTAAPNEIEEVLEFLVAVRRSRGEGLSSTDPLLEAREIPLAEQFWAGFKALPPDDQKSAIRLSSLFRTPALFEHLLQQSRIEGRGNRAHGVEVAELALKTLRGFQGRLSEEELAHLQARGWAWLGAARELAEDLGGAEEALNQAEALIAAFPPPPIRVQTEILYFRSCLRTRQRQVEEALELAGHALDMAQTFDCAELRAEIFIARGNAAYSVADWSPALEDYRSAESLMTADSNAYLQLAAQHGVAWTAFKLGLLSEARDARLRGKKSAKNLGDQSVMPRLAWLEGLIALEDDDYGSAERILRSTRESFVLEGNYRNQGLVSLDLALTLYYIGNFAELKALMLETLPIFEYLRLDAEALALVDILRHSVSRNKIEARVLTQLRNRLEQS